ncbi:MAG: ABC transporter ATP-binding protein [Candidatus Rokuibacteriota bacterium]
MGDIVIRVENLSKQYRIGEHTHNVLRDAIAHSVKSLFTSAAAGAARSRRTIWALKDVSFEVEHGELVGLIGRNGSGKSTLLKILSRISNPTIGTAAVRGRLGSLLQVGTGFHGELTGRENIYLNGAILGMRKTQIDRRFEEITAFAEVDLFLDTPVKHYSSGMYVRLAFAVAAHLEPDILLVDEVLAVGDSEFQQKCLKKMRQVAYDGRTVVFVSHNLSTIQALTNRTLLLDHGQLVASGPTIEVIQQYLRKPADANATVYELEDAPRDTASLSRAVSIVRLALDRPVNRLPQDDTLAILATVRGSKAVKPFALATVIYGPAGLPIGTLVGPETHSIEHGEVATFKMALPPLRLSPGSYHCALAVIQSNSGGVHHDLDLVSDVLHFEVTPPRDATTVRAWHRSWGPIRFDEPTVERLA